MPARNFRVFHVNAFTQDAFCGNPAGVVLDADGLSDAEMQLIARELNCGDTAFVLAPTGPNHDLRLRFFTPTREVPFVGHATVAAHFVRNSTLGLRAQRQRQLSGVGLVEIDAGIADGRVEIGIRQVAAQLQRALPHSDLGTLFDALGVSSADLDPRCPVEVYAKGGSRLLLGLRSPAALASLRPDEHALTRLTPHIGADGYFLFTLAGETPGCLTEARMFCPVLGIPEDPVSGNAHAMLGAYLVRHGLLPTEGGRARFRGAQGQAVDRPGSVLVDIELQAGRIESVRVAGTAVVVFETTLVL